jgi:serralysin
MTKQFLILHFVIVFLQSSMQAQTYTCTDILLPTNNNTSLYQGVYYSDLRWAKQKITVSFRNGTRDLHQKVMHYASDWSKFSGISFELVPNSEADIRIGFYNGKGSWSLIGRHSFDFSVDANTGNTFSGRSGISMNFGWFNSFTPEEELRRTTLHEFGHALGLLHEHMHPHSEISWNRPKVYAYYLQTQNWSKEQVDRNVFQKYSVDQTNGQYDALSIMHYPIPKEFTINGYEVGQNSYLSEGDKKTIGRLYANRYTPEVYEKKSPHRITDLFYGDGVWALTMSKYLNYGAEAWRTNQYFPEKQINELWNQQYMITNLSYGNGIWAVVMKTGTEYKEQIWRTRTYFPEKEIEEFWKKGYKITNLTYGQNLWGLVMSKADSDTRQIWRTRTYFPQKEIQEFWDKGYRISHLEYCNSRWVLIMDSNTKYTEQVWRTRSHFPKDEIDSLWKKGFYITKLSYGNSLWSLVMSKGTSCYYQSWRTRTTFPQKEIDDLWKE